MGHTPSRHAAAPLPPVAPTVRLGSSARLRAKVRTKKNLIFLEVLNANASRS